MTEEKQATAPRGELEDALVKEVCELVNNRFSINSGRDVLSLIQVTTRVFAAHMASAYCMLGEYDLDKCLGKLEEDFPAHFNGLKDLLQRGVKAEIAAWGKVVSGANQGQAAPQH